MVKAAHGGQAADPAPVLIAGRYRLERLLGTGGMGSVFAAVDLATGDTIALKRLAAGSTAQTRALFEREYQTLAALSFPHIVAVYDYGVDEAGPFYTMELVEGRELILEAPMHWRDACLCLRDVAAILGFLHARRLLHRDLSPRNLLRVQGRLKLIDFGALTPFGVATELVGTPPFVAPEALLAQSLDQRADLFSLGALGYWLLTGEHAFPARGLAELARLHAHPPTLASRLLPAQVRAQGDDFPPSLDALLAALLSRAPQERPSSAAVVVDRLNAIADLLPESNALSVRGYLESSVFVGREPELALVASALDEAREGRGVAILACCDEGLGRTRFLRQLAVSARLSGALTLVVKGVSGQPAYAGAAQLARALLDALPLEAKQTAAPLAADLSRISESIRVRLGVAHQAHADDAAGETRIKVQLALRAWLHALSASRCMALLVDDVHLLDDESRSLLVTLADGIARTRVVLVATASGTAAPTAALVSLRERSRLLALPPLTSPEALTLLRSVFGEVQYLARCAERLWRASSGNPAHCLALAQQLVQDGLARYEEGAWTLPSELSASQLAATHEQAQLTRLDRLSARTRALAALLSIPHEEPLRADDCSALFELSPAQTELVLQELVREGVLAGDRASYAFVHASSRDALFSVLAPERRTRAQRSLAQLLAQRAGDDGLLQVRAALQFLRAGEVERALPLLKRASAYYATGAPDALASLPRAAPVFEEVYAQLSARGASDHVLTLALGTLALSAYFVDRRYEPRFGATAMDAYARVLQVALARRLSRFVGPKLALLLALLVAFLTGLRTRHAASLRQTIADFTAASAALAGTATACLMPERARHYAEVLSPFAPLGPSHTINVVHDTSMLFSMLVGDRVGATAAGLASMVGRIERGEVLRDLPEGRRNDYVAGLYLSLGVQACWKDEPEALRIADTIERFSPMHAMTADHFRAAYYENQGQTARARHYQQRVEMHAVQLGSTWQVELWAPVDAAKTAMRLHDPLVIRHVFQDLSRLGAELPSFAREERRARGMYLVLSGQYDKAVPLLELDEEPLSVIGWSFTRGALARAYNGLGQHARAKEICEDALARRTPEDEAYPVIGLNVQVELAHAESGLHEHTPAAARLDALIEEHAARRGAVTLGMLHEARAWVALRAGELATCREQLAKMEAWYQPTGVASLLERSGLLLRALEAAEHPAEEQTREPRAWRREAEGLTLLAARLQERATEGLPALAQTALELIAAQCGAAEVFLVLADGADEEQVFVHGSPLDDALLAWARAALQAADVDEQTEVGPLLSPLLDPFAFTHEQRRYRALELRREDQDRRAFGILALGLHAQTTLPSLEAVGLLARQLSAQLPDVRTNSSASRAS